MNGRLSGGVWILCPAGAMTLNSGCEQVRDMLVAKYDEGFHHLILDCSQLTTVDSNGLGEMVAAYSAIVRRGGALKLLQPSPRLLELLRMTRLNMLLESHTDERACVLSFTSQADAKAKQALNEFLK